MLPQAMNAVMPRLTMFEDGITAVDTEYVRPQMDAAHVVVAGSRAAIVDTGANTAVSLILAGRGRRGIERGAGEILSIARERLVIAQDGQRFDLGDRHFECVHTPGHALHHQAIVDHGAVSIFTGDTFGLSYREFDTAQGPWIMPTTTPTQFDPGQLKASIVRLMQFRPRRLYLTHYSEVGQCARLANDMYEAIEDYVRIARASGVDPARMRFSLRD